MFPWLTEDGFSVYAEIPRIVLKILRICFTVMLVALMLLIMMYRRDLDLKLRKKEASPTLRIDND